MKRPQPHFISFGPPTPIVPRSKFTAFRLSEEDWRDAWTLIGPSVELNMSANPRTGGCAPLWKLLTAAYLEGLHHGQGAEREIARRANAISTPAFPESERKGS